MGVKVKTSIHILFKRWSNKPRRLRSLYVRSILGKLQWAVFFFFYRRVMDSTYRTNTASYELCDAVGGGSCTLSEQKKQKQSIIILFPVVVFDNSNILLLIMRLVTWRKKSVSIGLNKTPHPTAKT